MWTWKRAVNAKLNINKEVLERFKKHAKIGGILFMILGAVGILYPTIMSLTTLAFVSYLMVLTGFLSAILTWKSNKKDWAGWLKSIILILTGVYMVIYPTVGIATLGLLFAMYFFMDAFASFGLAFSLKPEKIWWLWLFNGFTSLLLGVLFIIGWPSNSIYLVGLFVGISLFFDGVALFGGALAAEKLEKVEDSNEVKA